MTRGGAIHRIAILWLVLPLPALVLLTVQTIGGKYGDDATEAWSWLLAQLAPILALILASMSSDPSKSWKEKPANLFRWRSAVGSSLLYGLIILGLLLVEPLLPTTSYDLFTGSSWLLAVLQGVVVACIGTVIFDGR